MAAEGSQIPCSQELNFKNYEVIDANRNGHFIYIHQDKAYVQDGLSETCIYLKCQHVNNKSKPKN